MRLVDLMQQSANRAGCNVGNCKWVRYKGKKLLRCRKLTSCPKKQALAAWAKQFNAFYWLFDSWLIETGLHAAFDTNKKGSGWTPWMIAAAVSMAVPPLMPISAAVLLGSKLFDKQLLVDMDRILNIKSNAVQLRNYAQQYEKLRVQFIKIIATMKKRGQLVQSFALPPRLSKEVMPTGPWDIIKRYGPWIIGGTVAVAVLPSVVTALASRR